MISSSSTSSAFEKLHQLASDATFHMKRNSKIYLTTVVAISVFALSALYLSVSEDLVEELIPVRHRNSLSLNMMMMPTHGEL